MNHSPSGLLLLSKAIPGFINYKTAEGLALRTIDSHERLLNKWLEHIGDQEIGKITAQDMVRDYAQITEINIAQAHHKASSVDNWRL